jgi:hypothetical protein
MTKILVKTATHDLQILRFEIDYLTDLSVPLCPMSLRLSALRRPFDQERDAEKQRITLLRVTSTNSGMASRPFFVSSSIVIDERLKLSW